MQTNSTRSTAARPRRAWHAILALLAVGIATLASAAPTALQPGEALTYNVRWAVVPGAGQIRIAATADEGADPRVSITTHTETRGLARSLLPFEARSESIYDVETGRLLALREASVARQKHVRYAVEFDLATGQAQYTGQDATVRTLDVPEGDPADLITTLLKTRLWGLQVGDTRDVLVSYRDDFYLVTLHATGHERVRTPLGTFETVVIEPRMEKTPPKGMFKRGAQVRVWVSRDTLRLPVRFQVEFKVGTGIATLASYTPPADVRLAADE